jgi:hypothetical protein
MMFVLEFGHIPNRTDNTQILEHVDFLAWTPRGSNQCVTLYRLAPWARVHLTRDESVHITSIMNQDVRTGCNCERGIVVHSVIKHV